MLEKLSKKQTKGKIITVSSPDNETSGVDGETPEVSTPTYTNVLAFTTIPEIYKLGQESKIKIKWLTGPASAEASAGEQEMPFTAHDLNNNGRIDYIEWTVPHLSDQIFEIIFISKAFHLDQNKEIIADIYDTVRYQDNTWATVPANNYIRVTFQQVLDNTKDITVYAKPAGVRHPPAFI